MSGHLHRCIGYSKIIPIWQRGEGKTVAERIKKKKSRARNETTIRKQTTLVTDLVCFSRNQRANGNSTVLQFTLCIKWKQMDCSGQVSLFLLSSKAIHFSCEFLNCFMWWVVSLTSWQWPSDKASWAPRQRYTKAELAELSKGRSADAQQWDACTELFARFLEFRDRCQRPSRKRGVMYA